MNRRFRWWPALLAVGVFGLGLVGLAGAADDTEKPAAAAGTKALDKQLYDMLRDLHNRGADLYNSDDAAGCYRMFQGGLIAVRPALAHHPDVQKAIDVGMEDAARNPSIARRAFALHILIENVRGKINPNPKAKETTLWERLGGEANVKKVVDDFVDLAANDAKVDFTRGGRYKLEGEAMVQLKKGLVDFVSMATGGPLKYTGKSMKEVHKGMGITDAQFAAAADLKEALEKNGAKPADIDEVLKAVGGTRKDIVEKKADEEQPANTLWERLGGEANVKKVVDDFVDLAANDAKVDFTRGGKYKVEGEALVKLKKGLVDFVSMATGGPLKYTGKSMKEVHKGMGITDAQFDAVAADLKKALEKNGAKQADIDEVLKAVGGTRKDIVEKKSEAKPDDKRPDDKKPGAKDGDKRPDDKRPDDK
jgi:truncated hemoglobin YjbI